MICMVTGSDPQETQNAGSYPTEDPGFSPMETPLPPSMTCNLEYLFSSIREHSRTDNRTIQTVIMTRLSTETMTRGGTEHGKKRSSMLFGKRMIIGRAFSFQVKRLNPIHQSSTEDLIQPVA